MCLSDIEGILESIDSNSNHAFSFTTNTATENMRLSIKDVGEIKFPVDKTTIKQLIKHASPALFGYKDKTIYDPKVRNTWELDKSHVKIDMRKWKSDLKLVLEQMASALFPEGTELTAELHNLLIYEPDQFFKKHQDSEKTEDMQASLVVILPTKYPVSGGELIIEHGAKKQSYGNEQTRSTLQHVGFYADCIHEVSKVTEGHRLALTFNVSIKTRGIGSTGDCPPALIEKIQDFFKTPIKQQYSRIEESSLFCVLTHQYTPISLNWNTLKRNDISVAHTLKAAAEKLGLEVYLGSFNYKVTFDVINNDDHYYGYRRRRRYRNYHDETKDTHDDNSKKSSRYETGDILCEEWSWISCIDKNGEKVPNPDCNLYHADIIELGGLDKLDAYNEEYEGFMGNAGNTLDRLYHRAGVIIRDPQTVAFKRIIEAPLTELKRLDTLKNSDQTLQQLEKYFPYAQCFPLEKQIIEQIITMCTRLKRIDLLNTLITENHYHLLFELPNNFLINLNTESKKVIDKMMQEYIKRDIYRAKDRLLSLLKTCMIQPALCEQFAYFIPNFITSVTSDIKSHYCFDRERYNEQVKNASMVLDFALHAGCFNQALPLLEHMQKHPLAYPAELFVLNFPPNAMRLTSKNLIAYYKICLKELKTHDNQESESDAGEATLPIDNCLTTTPPPKKSHFASYASYASVPSQNVKELLSFLRSKEVTIKLQLYKKNQDGIISLIRRHGLPVQYDFGCAKSRYFVNYQKDLTTSKTIRLKRIKNSKEALSLLEALTTNTQNCTMTFT